MHHKTTRHESHGCQVPLFTILALLLTPTLTQAQWDIQDSHTTASMRGIANVGGGVAWASGTEGTVLRTEDGGYLWQTCATPPGAEKLDFRGIQAFDENTAIVMSSGKGDLSRLYKTTDGCRTWKLLFTNPDKEGFFDAIQFQFNARQGYFTGGVLVGDPVNGKFPIFREEDHGSTWHPLGQDYKYQTIPPALARTGESLFAASNTAVTATADGDTFAFVTGGKGGARLITPEWHGWGWGYDDFHGRFTFSETRLPIPSSETSGAFSIASRRTSDWNSVDLMIVGGDYKNPAVGTAVFIRHSVPFYERLISPRVILSAHPPHGYRSAVAYDPTTKTWITVGPNGTDISRDDGKNWSPLKPTASEPLDADKNWNALSLPFVVGPHGRIGKLRGDALKP